MSGSSEYERRARKLALLSYALGGAALIGFGVTALAVGKMLGAKHRGDALACLTWQRVRVVSTSLAISCLSLPLLLPSLSHSSILFRTSTGGGV